MFPLLKPVDAAIGREIVEQTPAERCSTFVKVKGDNGRRKEQTKARWRLQTMTEERGGTIRRLEESVKALYDFRDSYFLTHSARDGRQKWEDVQEKLKNILAAFGRSKKIETKDRAKYYYLLGKALNVMQSYNAEAEQVLAKAIKLDTKLYKAWNELGETYCKKKDLDEARNCFLGALEQQRNPESLRNLSILIRTEKFRDSVGGMKYAKEAVEMDPKDGRSWLVLGNAYISLYGSKQDPKILRMCKSAYSIAEKDERLATDPSLPFNRGIVEKYQDDYEAALRSFEKAEMLEPTWKEPLTERAKIVEYLEKAQTLADDKGKLKGKRLKNLIRGINAGIHSWTHGNRKPVHLKDLKNGANKGKMVVGAAAATFTDDSRFNIVLVDARESSAIVNVYNLPQGTGILVGSVLAVNDPFLKTVRINGNGKSYAFNAIRVENPAFIAVNGNPIHSSKTNIYFTTTICD